ncbi:DEKNAAC105289 [Brettanomyces naardenensis]|uniref:DEKNAAC105289 n=1 Tax=Brettanomyces naardenensis TaxID=13370 RepID=A0A448YT12_BRENA|nr:DEKNAAC105289 [Brettanomyces naardenensis]
MDTFLETMEDKLDYLERYIMTDSYDSTTKNSVLPSPQLLETWTAIRNSMAKNHEKGLHPLSQLVEGAEDQSKDTTTAAVIPSFNPPISPHYSRILDRLQQLDAKLDAFEESYSIMPKNPQETLKDLRSLLYNYEKAMVAGSHRLLHFYELPFQWRENKFIVFGYRFSKSHTAAFKSIVEVHNETANIWSHLLGAVLMIYLALFHYPSTQVYALTSTADHFVTFIFFAAATKCLLFSVIWHTYANISTLHLRQKFACFDYTGITVLIIASIITTEHIALRDFPVLRWGYVIFSFLTGVAGVAFSWSPQFDKPGFRPVRILFFISLAALGATAFITSCFKKGLFYSFDLYSPLLASFVWYLTGVVFYGSLIPERWRSDVVIDELKICDETILELDRSGKLEEYLDKEPEKTKHYGKFLSLWWVDYIFSSHNIWHMFVVMGILGHYYATLRMFKTIL